MCGSLDIMEHTENIRAQGDSQARKPIILTVVEVLYLTSKSRTTLWRDCRAGRFPNPRRLSPNRIGWLRTEIEEWAKSLPLSQPTIEEELSE